MNLTTPPFDDVHVRKAMNLVMDLEGVLRAWGGPVQGATPTDVLPDSMIPELTNENYTPYQKAPFAGDVEAAKAEMKLSKYDTDKDGLCDAPACKGVIHLNRNFAPWSTHSQIVVQSAAKIGVQLQTRRGLALDGQRPVGPAEPEDPDQLGQRLGQGLRRTRRRSRPSGTAA